MDQTILFDAYKKWDFFSHQKPDPMFSYKFAISCEKQDLFCSKSTDEEMKDLKSKPISGRPARLQDKPLKWLCKVLTDKTPQQFKLPFALWTRDKIIEVVKHKFGIKHSKIGLSRILDKLGFTFQKPTVRYKQQDPIIVGKWLISDFPAIQAEAKKIGADIYFGDEASVSSTYSLGKTIEKKGVTPVVQRTTKRFRVNMLSTITAKGHCRFMVTEKSGTASVFVIFLKRLLVGANHPIFLILDNHPIHKFKLVQDFVEKNKNKLKLFFLPPYSPELRNRK